VGKIKDALPLWRLAQQSGIVALRCRKCQHDGFVTAQALMSSRIESRAIQFMNFKCSKCGGRNIIRRAFIPA